MKVALIGCGSIAKTHLDVLKHLGHDVIALCDRSEEKAVKLRDDFGLDCKVYTDYTVMMDKAKPDSVHVCTPHYEHAEMSIAALNRGINVLCEKPVCISDEQYYELKKAADLSSAKIGICFQNRYLETNEKLKALCETEGAKGIFATVPWARDEKYYKETDWRGRRKTEGGGVMMNQAIHTLDLIIWMLGEPIAVTGSVGNNHLKGVIDEEDTAEIYVEFKSGTKATFYATTAGAFNSPVIISLATDKGHYTAVGNKVYDGAGLPVAVNEKIDIIAKDYWGNGHLHLIRDFYDHVTRGEDFSVGVTEAYKAVKTVLELYASKGARREIDFSKL